MTCNVTELHHHIGWFDDESEVYCQTETGIRCEIIRLEDHDGKPVLIIRRLPVQQPTPGGAA